MQIVNLPNADASIITITSTATSLYDLIEAAGSAEILADKDRLDYVLFSNEGSDTFRVLFDGNTPTASKGLLVGAGVTPFFNNLDKCKLIRVGGSNVTVGVQIGFSNLEQ